MAGRAGEKREINVLQMQRVVKGSVRVNLDRDLCHIVQIHQAAAYIPDPARRCRMRTGKGSHNRSEDIVKDVRVRL